MVRFFSLKNLLRWFVAIGIFSVFNETKNHNSWPLLTGNYSMGSSGVPTTPSAGNPNLNFVTRLFPTNTTKGLIARDDALLYVKDSEFQVTGDFSVTSETIVLRISQTNTEKKCDLSLIRKKRCKELSYTVIVHDEENYFAMMKTGFIIGLLMLSVSLLIIAVSIYSRRQKILNKSISQDHKPENKKLLIENVEKDSQKDNQMTENIYIPASICDSSLRAVNTKSEKLFPYLGTDVLICTKQPTDVRIRFCPPEEYAVFNGIIEKEKGLTISTPIIQITDFEHFHSNNLKEMKIRHNVYDWEKYKECSLRCYNNMHNETRPSGQ